MSKLADDYWHRTGECGSVCDACEFHPEAVCGLDCSGCLSEAELGT